MTDVVIIFLFWAILFIVAFVFLPLWRRHHDTGVGLYGRTQDDNKLSINYALKQLNCKAKWEKDHEDLICSYTFQRGKFRIRLEKKSPYVRLSYLFFFTANLQHIETVRSVCNRCNLNTETCRLTYTIDQERGEVDVHMVNALLLNDSTVREVLERAMENIFLWQRQFMKYYEEADTQGENLPDHDAEKVTASLTREQYLAHELEMVHQEEGPDWHEHHGNPMLLGRMLNTMLGLTDIVPAELTLLCEGQTTLVDDPDAIMRYNVAEVLIADGAFAHTAAWLMLGYYDPRRPVRLRRVTIALEQEGHTDDTLYYRATATLTPLSLSHEVMADDVERQKMVSSVLLGYDLTDDEQRQAEFRYRWKEAMAKQQNGETDDLSEDERWLFSLSSPAYIQSAWRGKVLFEEKRFYESVMLLENVFHHLERGYHKMGAVTREAFADVCYYVGACYAHLGQYQRAIYYLQMILPMHRIRALKAFINSLVNSGDFRALDYIDFFLRELQPVVGEERQNDTEGDMHEAVAFANFLKRRKVCVLIDNGRYDEAESLLKLLLDDPVNSGFALKELAYIQKKKERS